MIQTGISNFYLYLSADIMFEIIMAVVGFVTVIWLFKPLTSVLQKLMQHQNLETSKAYK